MKDWEIKLKRDNENMAKANKISCQIIEEILIPYNLIDKMTGEQKFNIGNDLFKVIFKNL